MTGDWWLAIGLFAFGAGCCLLAELKERKEREKRYLLRKQARLLRQYGHRDA